MSKYPKAFLEQMLQLLGPEANEKFLASLQGHSPVSVRYNPYKITEMPIASERVPWASFAYYLPERPVFTVDPLFHAGAYYVQEASSMFLEQAFKQHCKPESRLRILDLCAAPGGKSTLIAGLMNSESMLLSNEVIRSRAFILSENIQKYGREHIWVSNNDPSAISKSLPAFFDVIITDAPCSGEGMFRKADHSIGEWSVQAVQHCSLRQQRILHDIWKALRPGGIMIYSTCTFNESENEENLLKFRAENDFESLRITLDESWKVTETYKDRLYSYRFYPHLTKGEGFFLSVLKKAGESEVSNPKLKKNLLPKAPKETDELKNWCLNGDLDFFKRNESVIVVPKSLSFEAQLIESSLNIISGGTELAEFNRKGFSPAPAAALWTGLNPEAFTIADFDLEETLHYLHLDNVNPDTVPDIEGWQLVSYQGHALGWIKKLSNRVNNYFPKEWKIRLSLDKLR
jgi:16S rRNA C967 or C1407 C5-methylase (RsmB/RsmF family)/NOL1/NOP2/fmu family ribosome biogenesis protein